MLKVKKKKVKKKKRTLPVKSKKARKRVPKSKRKRMGKDLLAKDGTKRRVDGKFPKGVCGNPKGRPKGSGYKYSVTDLQTAIEDVEKSKGGKETFLQAWVKAAWGNAGEMAAVANFMMPKLRAIEQITLAADSMSDEEAEDIRKEKKEQMMVMLKRFRGG